MRIVKRVLKIVLCIVAVVAVPAQARQHEAASQCATNHRASSELIGSWRGVAVSTIAPLPPLATLMTFSPDGTLVESRRLYLPASPLGALIATPSHGAWLQRGPHEYDGTTLLLYEGAFEHPSAPGVVVGEEKVRFKLTVSDDGTTMSGEILVQVKDATGAIVFEGPGTLTATRIDVEPLP